MGIVTPGSVSRDAPEEQPCEENPVNDKMTKKKKKKKKKDKGSFSYFAVSANWQAAIAAGARTAWS
jgi:hypothetical protein